ncbi:MAG: CPXCG motif-containing cysteine-rich protein [Pseudomonadales bacterium]|jgi:hypothetical protein
MTFGSEVVHVYCPYCGEYIEVIIDLSVDHQEYVEDCSVCCRPIVMNVRADDGGASVSVRAEDE